MGITPSFSLWVGAETSIEVGFGCQERPKELHESRLDKRWLANRSSFFPLLVFKKKALHSGERGNFYRE